MTGSKIREVKVKGAAVALNAAVRLRLANNKLFNVFFIGYSGKRFSRLHRQELNINLSLNPEPNYRKTQWLCRETGSRQQYRLVNSDQRWSSPACCTKNEAPFGF